MIEHSLPASLTPKPGSKVGLFQPGLEVTKYQTGPKSSRLWQGFMLREINYTLSTLVHGSDKLKLWERYLNQIAKDGGTGWYADPLTGTHDNVQCGPPADGSQTTFPLPVQGATDLWLYLDGALVAPTEYTLHAVANLLDDDSAGFADGKGEFRAGTSVLAYQVEGIALDGLCSLQLVPQVVSTDSVFWMVASGCPAVTVGQEYTAIAHALGSHDMTLAINWLDNLDAVLSTDTSTTTLSGSLSAWQALTVTATAPTDAVKAQLVITAVNPADTSACYWDCVGLAPGDLTRWWLPSLAPMAVEMSSAPTTNYRLLADATGKRLSKCRLAKMSNSWGLSSPGHAKPQSFKASEEVWL